MARVEAGFDDTVVTVAVAAVGIETAVEDEMPTGSGKWTADAD